MSKRAWWIIALVAPHCTAIGAAWWAYRAAVAAPLPPAVAVVDMVSIVQQAADRGHPQAAALVEKLGPVLDQLAAQGVVVIDAQSVLRAPEDVYVHP